MLCHGTLLWLFAALLEEFGDQGGPAGLMTGANTRTVVTVKVFIEQQQVAPVRILLELLRAAIDS